MMNAYCPFIYEPKKKETLEPLPLYIEVEPPPQEEEKLKEDERPGVIIIELFWIIVILEYLLLHQKDF